VNRKRVEHGVKRVAQSPCILCGQRPGEVVMVFYPDKPEEFGLSNGHCIVYGLCSMCRERGADIVEIERMVLSRPRESLEEIEPWPRLRLIRGGRGKNMETSDAAS